MDYWRIYAELGSGIEYNVSFLFLLQAPELQWFASLGVGGGLAAFVILLWRNDRRTWEERYERLASEHSRILNEFRSLVTENTQAITSLRDNLRNIVQCPYADDLPIVRKPSR